MNTDFLESQELGVKHVNGVGHASMYYKFPHFQTSKQLPQCSSHDLLEGCVKLWMKLILENLVKAKWFSWEALETLTGSFPFRGKDANSRQSYRYQVL